MTPTDNLIRRLRLHDDPRLYHEADVLMADAATALQAQQYRLNTQARMLECSVSKDEYDLVVAERDALLANKPTYTTGHCSEKSKPGGCQLHNLQCGYPNCDRKSS